ncbi:hypothetical protein ACIO93_12160 [Streptomyces sp. NPDC087903]|uniref:hypothetical protein n=1 Tax=Streptomyces sp. NPDC087903 TaxID=3365819 RepID=UPI003826BD06
MPGPTPTPHAPGGEMAALVTQLVDELARRLAQDITRDSLHSPTEAHGAVDDARGRALVRLRVLADVREAARHLEDQAAHTAAASGAGYPEIGQAVSMSRQGARRRWPGLITHTTHRPATPPIPRSS